MTEAAKDVEVQVKATRRRFTSEYKRAILREADACTKRGEIGALLRREGLYSSHLLDWRLALVALAVVPLLALTARARNRALRTAQHASALRSIGCNAMKLRHTSGYSNTCILRSWSRRATTRPRSRCCGRICRSPTSAVA